MKNQNESLDIFDFEQEMLADFNAMLDFMDEQEECPNAFDNIVDSVSELDEIEVMTSNFARNKGVVPAMNIMDSLKSAEQQSKNLSILN